MWTCASRLLQTLVGKVWYDFSGTRLCLLFVFVFCSWISLDLLSRVRGLFYIANMVYISFVIFTALLSAAITMAADKDTGVTFLYPPAGLTFNYLDTINVSYTSPFSSPYLVTYCLRYNGGDPLESMILTSPTITITIIKVQLQY